MVQKMSVRQMVPQGSLKQGDLKGLSKKYGIMKEGFRLFLEDLELTPEKFKNLSDRLRFDFFALYLKQSEGTTGNKSTLSNGQFLFLFDVKKSLLLDVKAIQKFTVVLQCKDNRGKLRASSGTLVRYKGSYFVTTLAHCVLDLSNSGKMTVRTDFILSSEELGVLRWTKLLYNPQFNYNDPQAFREAALFCVEETPGLLQNATKLCIDNAFGRLLSAVSISKRSLRLVRGAVTEVSNAGDETHYYISDTSGEGCSGSGMFIQNSVYGVIQGFRCATDGDAERKTDSRSRGSVDALIAGLVDHARSYRGHTRVIAAKEFVKVIDMYATCSGGECEELCVYTNPASTEAITMSFYLLLVSHFMKSSLL